MATTQASKLLGTDSGAAFAAWAMLQQLLSVILAPELTELQQFAFSQTPTRAMDVMAAADAVVKGHIKYENGAGWAAQNGFSESIFRTLVEITGQPLALDQLTEAWRRGINPEAPDRDPDISLEAGIKESHLANKWLAVVKALQFRVPPDGAVVEGWLRNVIGEKEARGHLYNAGFDDATATLLYKAAGRPISPGEAWMAFHRGLIPEEGEGGDVLSMRQAFLESDLKNKWWPVWKQLQEYLPPPRTVTAMLREGVFTDVQALDLFRKSGLSEELAAAYVAAAHHQKVAADKELAKGNVLALYRDKLVTTAEATAMLASLGYHAPNAAFLLELEDFKAAQAALSNALTRLRTLYIAHKLDRPETVAALDKLGVQPAARDEKLYLWDQERANNVQELTAAEVASLYQHNLMSGPDALGRLVAMGFDEVDGWYRLAAAIHGKPLDLPTPADYSGTA